MFVAKTQPGCPTCSRSSAKTCFFVVELLEDRLDHEVAVGEVLVAGRRRDQRGEEAGLALVVAAFRDLLLKVGLDALARARERLLADVAHCDRHLQAADDEGCELSRHQARADDPDLADRPRLGVRLARRVLRPALDEVERIQRRLRLAAGQQLAHRLLLGAVALLERPAGAGALDEVERHVRSGRRAVHLPVQPRACLADDVFFSQVLGPVPGTWPFGRELEREGDRLVDELGRLEQAVREAELEGVRAGQHPVLAHRVRHYELDGRLDADEARDELRPAPGRHDPEEALGAGEVPHGGRDRPRCRSGAPARPLRPRHAPLTAATVGYGRSRMRPKSSWPTRLPSIARSRVAPGNSVMSAPAAKTNGLPVTTSAAQSPSSSSGRSRSSDSSAARPKNVGFV